MFKIRIKNSPSDKKTGEQEEYGLVRNLASMQTTSNEVAVNDKMGAIPRDKATIEVEGGESVIGDVNKDGNMELMHFVGKKHSQGGVPVDVPEGSFVYSDTKSLIIKDKEVLEKIFGLSFRKKGYTPAEISKNFDINKYIQILKDENADEISKRTAAEMLRKNKEKLGILAFIQESMKGFPDGIPSIAEEVMAQMGVDPQQLMQEAQPEPPQEGQPQQGGNPMEGMSPEDQEMMMAMMQQQGGAPMGEEMPMQKYGGLTQYAEGGNNIYQALELQKSGYNADPLVNNQVQTKVPGVDMNPFIYNANDRNVYDSLRKNPVEGFENSGFEQGKIYTFKSRPGSYYKIGNDGRLHIKNQGTNWEYKPMDDPEGKRRQVLEAGFNSGLTKEFVKSKAQAKTSKFQLPGFDDKEEFNDFLQSGTVEKVVGQRYKQVLDSRDPKKILDLADELEKENHDVEYSLGFLPWSNQDKVQDMPDMLREEAAKILDKKQREKFLSNDASNVSTKLKTVIKDLEVKSAQNKNADINTRLKVEKELENAKKYLKYVQSEDYKGYINNIKTNLPQTDPGLFPDWKGDFAGANAYGYEVEPGVNVGDILNFANEKYNKIKNINKGKFTPTNLLGDETTLQPIAPISSLMTVLSGYDLEDVDFGKFDSGYISGQGEISENTAAKKAKVILPDQDENVHFEKRKLQDGSAYYYVKIDENNAEEAVKNQDLYDRLNAEFSKKSATPVNLKMPDQFKVEAALEVLDLPELIPAKEQLRNAVVKPKASVYNQGSMNPAPVEYTEETEDLSKYFKRRGGEMDMYEDGGVIDSFGHMIKLPKSYLQKFDNGGTPAELVEKRADGSSVYKQTFGDGTVLVYVTDSTGKIKSQNAEFNGTQYKLDPNEKLYRGFTEKFDANNISDEEKNAIKTKWGEKGTEAYGKYITTRNKFRVDNDLRKAMEEEYGKMLSDPTNAMYTGRDASKKAYFKNLYEKDLKNLKGDDLFNALMQMDEYNGRMEALGFVPKTSSNEAAGFDRTSEWYGKTGTDPATAEAYHTNKEIIKFKKEHPELADLDFTKTHRNQAAYISYMNALKRDQFKEYGSPLTGVADENVSGLSRDVTGVEGQWTNTSAGQRTGYVGKPQKEVETKTETPQGKWYCVDGQIKQGVIGTDGKETAPTGTNIQGPYPDKGTAEGVCKIKENTSIERKGDEYNGWFAPDIVNYTTALGQQSPFTLPSLQQMQAPPSGYDTINPITHIASIQGAAQQYNDLLANTLDPTTAGAAGSNFDFDALAKGVGNVEIQNVGISNNAYDKIAARNMQVDQYNAEKRGQYTKDVATAIDSRAKDYNTKQSVLAKMYGAGWWNAARDEGNRERYPQAKHINRLSGDYDFSGQGKNPFAPDTSLSYNNSSTDATTAANAEYQRVFKEAKAAGDLDDAAKTKAEAAMKQVYNDHNYYRNSKNRTQQDAYAGTFGSTGIQKYGGSLNFSAPDYDFFFG